MDTYICDTSALRYWSTPPLVASIMVGEAERASELGFSSSDQLEQVRTRALLESPLVTAFQNNGRQWARTGYHSRAISDIAAPLAHSIDFPVKVLARRREEQRNSARIQTNLWTGELPPDAFYYIGEDIHIAMPEFALLQVTKRESLGSCLVLASALCGTYAEFSAPPSIARHLESLHARGTKIPSVDGWKPFFVGGRLSSLWQRPPLATPESISSMAIQASHARGSKKLQLIADLVIPDAASQFETKAGLLLGLPLAYGGFGHSGLVHNQKIDLRKSSQSLSNKRCCYCDLYWPEGIDVECQSKMAHDNETSFLSDSERTTALLNEGITVLPLTYAQLANPERMDDFAQTLSKLRGIVPPKRTEKQMRKANELRKALFG